MNNESSSSFQSPSKKSPTSLGLAKLFAGGIDIPAKNSKSLERALANGVRFFKQFNQSRLRIAFDAFSDDMKKALYEVLYFLHVNDPRFAEWQYRGYKVQHISGITQESSFQATANLYIPKTPHGVQSINTLPLIVQDAFQDYITKEFGGFPETHSEYLTNPIVSVRG